MSKVENEDTRYFIEIDLQRLAISKVGYAQKESLDKGEQHVPDIHRLFLSKGQYYKFVNRCKSELKNVLDGE